MAKKKARSLTLPMKRGLIEPSLSEPSIRDQCALIALPRSSYYFHPATEHDENLAIMRLIDEEYTRHPFYGSRKFVAYLKEKGFSVVSVKRAHLFS